MADPRFKCQVASAANQSAFRAFGNAVGKIGDLNVMNSIGGGQVGAGLRTLASASNSIRGGCGSLPTSIGSSIESGANWVLGHVGITPDNLAAVNNFNPAVANTALSEATSLFNQVKSGNFKVSDIPNYLQNFQNVERLARNIYTPPTNSPIQGINCQTTPYAMDLVLRGLKHKFMFVVEIQFNTAYTTIGNAIKPIVMGVKKSTRPSTKFISEDVNYYNFRTKIITKTEVEEMKMSFYDDDLDSALQFVSTYRAIISPIATLSPETAIDLESKGMDFASASVVPGETDSVTLDTYSASRGPLNGDVKTPIKAIKLYHVFRGGTLVNTYTFINPRIVELNLDELDMAVGNEGNEVSFTFNYDSVFITTNSMSNIATDNNTFPGQTQGTAYPIRNNTDVATANASHAALPEPPLPTTCAPPGNINTSIGK